MKLFQTTILTLAALFIPASARAGVAASIKIEQISPASLGSWTFLQPNGDSVRSGSGSVSDRNHVFSISEFGPMTLSVVSPPGMSAKIAVYRGGELQKTYDTPQVSFELFPNDNYRFLIQYAYSRLGSLGITSEPSSLPFRMKGPTTKTYRGKTPMTFKNLPAGRYSLFFSGTGNCKEPAPQSAVIEPEKRNTIIVKLPCDHEAETVLERSRPTKRSIVEAATSREFKPRGERK